MGGSKKGKGRKGKKGKKKKGKRKSGSGDTRTDSKVAKLGTQMKSPVVEEITATEENELDLEFEDDFGDEYDSEDLEVEKAIEEGKIVPGDEERDGEQKEQIELEQTVEKEPQKIWRPSDGLEAGEELVFDPTAYKLNHSFMLPWPALSFDVLRDSLGDNRDTPPYTMYIVAGTQAGERKANKIYLLKLTDLCKLDHGEADFLEDDELEDEPLMDSRVMSHAFGGINRIRSLPQNPTTVSVWSSSGVVNIFDLSNHFASFDDPMVAVPSEKALPLLQKFNGHATEGYAMDWSPVATGRLATGDCGKYIYRWEPLETGWEVDLKPMTGHQDSVEDIQWSPSEPSVFASCSVDKTIKVWDVRDHSSEKLSIEAHDSDVNVISWNKIVQHLMLSGSDDNTFKVWDFRMLDKPYARYRYHNAPITSVDWHPKVDSILACSGEDDRITLWDLKVEADDVDGDAMAMDTGNAADGQGEAEKFPAQLMFEHYGVEDVKEVHWHPQIKDMLVSTSGTGFSLFIPSNLGELNEEEDKMDED